MKKVITRLAGGMGNQLFNYAAARCLSVKNDAELVLDDISGFAHDIYYRRTFQLDHFNIKARRATAAERMEPFSRVRRYLKRGVNGYVPFEKRHYIQEEGIGFDERLLHLTFNQTLYLEGIWQSENYFKDIDPMIRSDLEIKPPNDNKNLAMSEEIKNSESVMLHFRFHDERHIAKPDSLSPDYYSSAIQLMTQLRPHAHYFVFSDKPVEAQAWMSLKNVNVTYVSHNQEDKDAYADLWLMTQCKHFIIANSTFSWWGAWLGNHHDKIVITPNVLMRDFKPAWRGFAGVFPLEWIKL